MTLFMNCMHQKVNYIFQTLDFTSQNLGLEKNGMTPVSTLHCNVCKQLLAGKSSL